MAEQEGIENGNQNEINLEELGEANFFLGNEYYYEELEYEKAIENYKSVLENTEDDILRTKSLYWIGESYIKLNQISDALDTFNQLIEEFNDHYLVDSARRRIAYLKEIYGGNEDE